ncbi:hypothetical protein H9P43_009208 [Blastocladiella emersonii ATCC 22665]|nr:hypothetical protein H9P43_009208 [Blastocladiella emersonii ATCC 22665]
MPSPTPLPVREKYSISDALGGLYTCYSFRYQALSYYRYGRRTECDDKWDHFKFCMSIRTKPDDVADRKIAEREAMLAAEMAKRPSSLDVWELRDKPPANFPPEVADWSPATGASESAI